MQISNHGYWKVQFPSSSPSPSSPSSVGSVTIKSQSGAETTLEADVVVMGVGVAPATQYLKNSPGFSEVLDKTGAVPVDECLRVKGVGEGVYAIGMWPPFGFLVGSIGVVDHGV